MNNFCMRKYGIFGADSSGISLFLTLLSCYGLYVVMVWLLLVIGCGMKNSGLAHTTISTTKQPLLNDFSGRIRDISFSRSHCEPPLTTKIGTQNKKAKQNGMLLIIVFRLRHLASGIITVVSAGACIYGRRHH